MTRGVERKNIRNIHLIQVLKKGDKKNYGRSYLSTSGKKISWNKKIRSVLERFHVSLQRNVKKGSRVGVRYLSTGGGKGGAGGVEA